MYFKFYELSVFVEEGGVFMKNSKVLIALLLTSLCAQAQFVAFREDANKNKFLGLDISMCSPSGHGTFHAYQCGNENISGLLNVNFLSPELLGQQFYLYNNFMYWMTSHDGMGKWNGSEAAVAKKEAKARSNPGEKFSGSGVFMIILGTSSYLQQIVAPEKTCPEGQTLLAAQLKYNDGNSLTTWSQDAICLSQNDTFEIAVSHKQDDTVPPADAAAKQAKVADADMQGIDWMKDNGPSANYALADSSPRKIRLIYKNSGVIVTNKKNVQHIVSAKKAAKINAKKAAKSK